MDYNSTLRGMFNIYQSYVQLSPDADCGGGLELELVSNDGIEAVDPCSSVVERGRAPFLARSISIN
jgi:hypothetical protein